MYWIPVALVFSLAAPALAPAAIPLEPGAQKLVARVTATWALSR